MVNEKLREQNNGWLVMAPYFLARLSNIGRVI